MDEPESVSDGWSVATDCVVDTVHFENEFNLQAETILRTPRTPTPSADSPAIIMIIPNYQTTLSTRFASQVSFNLSMDFSHSQQQTANKRQATWKPRAREKKELHDLN